MESGCAGLARPVRLPGQRHHWRQLQRQVHGFVLGRVRLKAPRAGVRDFVPSTLSPDYRPKHRPRADGSQPIALEFYYMTPQGRRSMHWPQSKGWNRSFLGRKGANQPEQSVYLRTLSNLSNPAEVRCVLSLAGRGDMTTETPLTASQVAFAQQMLPFRYSEVVNLSSGTKDPPECPGQSETRRSFCPGPTLPRLGRSAARFGLP